MMVEISNGELLDKLSILKIKLDNISEDDKLKNIRKEFDILKIKDFNEKESGKMMAYLRSNKDFERSNVEIFKQGICNK